MPQAAQVPEAADRGYWYVVPVVSDADGTRPDLPVQGSGWCAWYGTVGGVPLCAVRTPEPLSGVAASTVTVGAVLAAAQAEGSLPAGAKPRGRIGGR